MNIWFCWCVVYDNSAKMPYKQQTTDIFICCQIISHEVVSCFLYEPTIFFFAVCYKTTVCRHYYYYFYGGASFKLESVNGERISLKKKE